MSVMHAEGVLYCDLKFIRNHWFFFVWIYIPPRLPQSTKKTTYIQLTDPTQPLPTYVHLTDPTQPSPPTCTSPTPRSPSPPASTAPTPRSPPHLHPPHRPHSNDLQLVKSITMLDRLNPLTIAYIPIVFYPYAY